MFVKETAHGVIWLKNEVLKLLEAVGIKDTFLRRYKQIIFHACRNIFPDMLRQAYKNLANNCVPVKGKDTAERDKTVSSTQLLKAHFIVDADFGAKPLVVLLELVSSLSCNWSSVQTVHRVCRKGFTQAECPVPEHRSVTRLNDRLDYFGYSRQLKRQAGFHLECILQTHRHLSHKLKPFNLL